MQIRYLTFMEGTQNIPVREPYPCQLFTKFCCCPASTCYSDMKKVN